MASMHVLEASAPGLPAGVPFGHGRPLARRRVAQQHYVIWSLGPKRLKHESLEPLGNLACSHVDDTVTYHAEGSAHRARHKQPSLLQASRNHVTRLHARKSIIPDPSDCNTAFLRT